MAVYQVYNGAVDLSRVTDGLIRESNSILHSIHVDNATKFLYYQKSTDNGATWTDGAGGASGSRNGIYILGGVDVSTLAYDTLNNELYIFYGKTGVTHFFYYKKWSLGSWGTEQSINHGGGASTTPYLKSCGDFAGNVWVHRQAPFQSGLQVTSNGGASWTGSPMSTAGLKDMYIDSSNNLHVVLYNAPNVTYNRLTYSPGPSWTELGTEAVFSSFGLGEMNVITQSSFVYILYQVGTQPWTSNSIYISKRTAGVWSVGSVLIALGVGQVATRISTLQKSTDIYLTLSRNNLNVEYYILDTITDTVGGAAELGEVADSNSVGFTQRYNTFSLDALIQNDTDPDLDFEAVLLVTVEIEDINTDIRAKGTVESYDINNDIRTQKLELYDISNDIRTTDKLSVIRDIQNDIRVYSDIPVLRDINNDIRCQFLETFDIENDIRVALNLVSVLKDVDADIRAYNYIPVLRDVQNDIRVYKEDIYDINTDIRYRTSSSTSTVKENNLSVVEGLYVNTQNVTLSVDAEKAVQMRFQNDVNTGSWSAWESYTTYKDWTLSGGDGLKLIYVQFKDAAGDTTEGELYATTTLDTSTPTMTTIEAYTEEDGSSIADSTYQTDHSPYFEWNVPVFGSTIVGYKYTMDDSSMGSDVNIAQPHIIVESGLIVSPNSGMRVQANVGYYYYAGNRYSFGSGTVLLDNGGAQDRIDLIYLDIETNTLAVVKGTEAASPAAPALPVKAVYLADILVEAGETTILSGDIIDKRETKIKLKFYETEYLSSGTHILRVRALSANGNWSNTAVFNLYVSSESPDIGEIQCWRDNTKVISISDATYQTADNTPYFEWSVPTAPGTMTYYYTLDGTEPDSGSSNTTNNYLDYAGSPFSAGVHVLTVKAKDSFGSWGQSRKFHFIYGTLDLSAETSVIGNTATLRQSQKEIHVHKVEFSLRSARLCEFEEPIAFDANSSFNYGETVAVVHNNVVVFRGRIVNVQRALDISSEKIMYRAVGPRAELEEEDAYTIDSEIGETANILYEDKSPQHMIDDLLLKFPKVVKRIDSYPSGANQTIELINLKVDQALQSIYDKTGHYGYYISPDGVLYTIDLNSTDSIDTYFGVYGQKISSHPEFDILGSDLEIDITDRYNRVIIEGARRKEIITVPAIWSNPRSEYQHSVITESIPPDRRPYTAPNWAYNVTNYIPQTDKKILKIISANVNAYQVLSYYSSPFWIIPLFYKYIVNSKVTKITETGPAYMTWHRDADGNPTVLAGRDTHMETEDFETPTLSEDGKIHFSNGLWDNKIDRTNLFYRSADVMVTLLVETVPLKIDVSVSGSADSVAKIKRIYNTSFKYDEEQSIDDTTKMTTYAQSLLAEGKDIKLSGRVTIDEIDTNWSLAKTINLKNADAARGWDTINAKVTSITWDFDSNNTVIELSNEFLGG